MSYDTLLDASFKGVPFYVTAESLRFGRRIVQHEYPNTSKQFGEDVGGFPFDFKVTGFVIGYEAENKLTAIINACNEGGAGLLILPTFGNRNVLAGECNVTIEPLTNVELITFELTFIESRVKAGVGEKDVKLAQQKFVSLTAEIMTEYEIDQPFDFASKLADLKSLCASVKNFKSNLKNYIAGTELGAFLKQVDLVADGIATVINTGRSVIDQFTGEGAIYNTLMNLFVGNGTGSLISAITRESKSHKKRLSVNPSVIAKQAKPNFEFTEQAVNFWPEDTAARMLRNEQRRDLVDMHKANLLAIGYTLLAESFFQTDTEANNARDELEAAYIEMLHAVEPQKGQPIIVPNNQRSRFLSNPDLLAAFEDVRLSALVVATTKQLVKYKIEQAKVYDLSCLNAAYFSQAEQIDSEAELIALARTMHDINGRKAYGLTGVINVPREV